MTLPPVGPATMRRAYGIARDFYAAGYDRDDLAQEALIGAMEARRDYRPNRGTTFTTFEHGCMTRRVMDAVNGSRRLKRGAGQGALPLTENATEAVSLTDRVIARDELRRLLAGLGRLSVTERRAVVGVALGFRYAEIGPHKQVDNALQRARAKLAA